MQDLPGQTFKNLIRIFLQDLERVLHESYKILQELPKVRSYKFVLVTLQESCRILDQILDKILHDISSTCM